MCSLDVVLVVVLMFLLTIISRILTQILFERNTKIHTNHTYFTNHFYATFYFINWICKIGVSYEMEAENNNRTAQTQQQKKKHNIHPHTCQIRQKLKYVNTIISVQKCLFSCPSKFDMYIFH